MPAIRCENQLDNNIAQYKFKQKNSVLSNKNVQKWSYTQITKKVCFLGHPVFILIIFANSMFLHVSSWNSFGI